MWRRIGRSVSLLVLVLAGAPVLGWAEEAPPEAQAKAKAQELARLQVRIQEIQAGLGTVERERDAHLQELRRTERRIGGVVVGLRELAARLEQQRGQLAGLEARRVEEQTLLDRQREALARQVRAAYALGRQERVKLLLNQEDPAMVSRAMVYYDYFNRARAERVAVLQESLGRLRATEAEIRAEAERLAVLRDQEETNKRELDAALAERQQAVTALSAEIRTKADQLRSLRDDEQRLTEIVEQVRAALADIPIQEGGDAPFDSLKGKLPWPARGRLAERFGGLRQAEAPPWDGVMIAAPEGREVRAVHPGRVAFADWLRGFGLLLILDHGDGYMSLYGHNQTLFKETGDWVEAGEVVALVGRSGGRLNAGVYFGIRYKGQAVDPAQWCRPHNGREVG